MPTVELNTGKEIGELHLQTLNPDGEDVIVLIHGMFGNLAQFYLTLAPFLSEKYHVIMYDLRCHGRSSCFKNGFDLISLTDDLKALLDQLNIEKCHLLGFSYGALIALKFSVRYKDLVDRIIAVEIPPKPPFPIKKRGTYTFDDFMNFSSTLTPNVRDNFLRSKRQIKNTFKTYEFIINRTTFVEDMNNEKAFDSDDYGRIEVPVQLFFGDKSICLPELHRISSWIKNKVISIGEGDHGFFMKNPEKTAKEIIRFLGSRCPINIS